MPALAYNEKAMNKIAFMIFIATLLIGCSDNKPEEFNGYSKVLHTVTLSDKTCADVILTIICQGHICTSHISSMTTECP